MGYKRKPKVEQYCSNELCSNKVLTNRKKQYCSITCRNVAKWQRTFKDDGREKIQCLDCGGWYVQVGSHVIQVHGYESAKEYKLAHGLDYGKGVIPKEYRDLKAKIAIDNETYLNLENGAPHRFTKGGRSSAEVKKYWKYRREVGRG